MQLFLKRRAGEDDLTGTDDAKLYLLLPVTEKLNPDGTHNSPVIYANFEG